MLKNSAVHKVLHAPGEGSIKVTGEGVGSKDHVTSHF